MKREPGSDVITEARPDTGQDPESPVPLHVGQPWWVPEAFGKRITVDLQFGDLQDSREVPHNIAVIWAAFDVEPVEVRLS